jgi:transposase InsO family protein
LIGTIRREFLDCVPFWNAHDLRHSLSGFQEYYNNVRVHRALNAATPDVASGEPHDHVVRLDDYRWESYCEGLYQLPVAA